MAVVKKSIFMDCEEVGQVLFRKDRRAKYLRITVRPDQQVVVTVPLGIAFSAAQEFVREKQDWVRRHLEKVRTAVRENPIYDGRTPLKTRRYKLDVRPHGPSEFRADFLPGDPQVVVLYPNELQVGDESVQDFIKEVLIHVYRFEAKEFLPPRVAELAAKYGFRYRKLFIKRHKSRWGSCSGVNNINLNLHLMRLPDELIDYVILHELVHTEIKNHSREFWERLVQVCPRTYLLRKKLHGYDLF